MRKYLFLTLILIAGYIAIINCDDSPDNEGDPILDSSQYIVGNWDCNDMYDETETTTDFEYIYTFTSSNTWESRAFEERTPNDYYSIDTGKFSTDEVLLTLHQLTNGYSQENYEDAENSQEEDSTMIMNYYASDSILGINYVLTRKEGDSGLNGGTWTCTYTEDDYEIVEEYTFGTDTLTLYYKETDFSSDDIDEGTYDFPLTMAAEDEFEYDMSGWFFHISSPLLRMIRF